MLAGAGRQAAHQLVPARSRIELVGDQAVLHHSCGDGFKVVESQFRQAVFRRQNFALFSDLDPPLQGSAGLGKDRLISGATAATDGTAAAMEQTGADAVLVGNTCDGLLGAIQLPSRGDNAAVFRRVRVAQHNLLNIA